MSRWTLVVALLALAVAGAPAEAGRPAGRATTTHDALTRVGARRISIGGVRVREEPHPSPAHVEGHFVAPNETARIFASVLRGRARDGGILAVGTLRGVENAVTALEGIAGIPSSFRLIQLDVDPGVTRFNVAHGEALASDAPAPALRRTLRRAGLDADRARPAGWGAQPKIGGPAGATRALAHVDTALEAVATSGPPLGFYFGALEHEPAEQAQTVYGSDARLTRARELARSGRSTAVNGSLVGKRTMADVGRALRTRGERLAVLDLSNAPDWLAAGQLGPLARNLGALPLTANATVLLTSEKPVGDTTRGAGYASNFVYVAMPARDFIAHVRRIARDHADAPGQDDAYRAMLTKAVAASTKNADGLHVVPAGAIR